ncbi:MAG: hypothetical protein ABF276_07080, partial [Sulfurovum sp.]
LRFDRGFDMTETILKEINTAVKLLNPELDLSIEYPKEDKEERQADIMNSIHEIIAQLIIEE